MESTNVPDVSDAPVKFDKVFQDIDASGANEGPSSLQEQGPFPKIVHFIYTGDIQVTWIEWLAVRAAITNLGAEQVKIWVDQRTNPGGEQWERILRMEKVKVINTIMPAEVFGVKIPETNFQSDVLRLQILFDEGGEWLALSSPCPVCFGKLTGSK